MVSARTDVGLAPPVAFGCFGANRAKGGGNWRALYGDLTLVVRRISNTKRKWREGC